LQASDSVVPNLHALPSNKLLADFANGRLISFANAASACISKSALLGRSRLPSERLCELTLRQAL
jgi:hypothetical protein